MKHSYSNIDVVYAVGGYWIISYVRKSMAIPVCSTVYMIKHISMFYLEVSIYIYS